jgi:cellulose biosynthesis protein BcsQ
MVNPDSYGREHQVYAVDFDPENLSSIIISKMDEGNWEDSDKVNNNENARFSISRENDYLIVQANKASMDLPTYQTWLNYALQELEYTMDSEYDVFDTVKEGWIYEIDLKRFPLVTDDTHRILMYELK